MVARFRAIHAVVRKIPRSRVLTYGQLAELAGFPGGARLAGAAMKRSEGIPWQRVVGKAGPRRGRIAIHDPVGAALQRQKLAAEGVPISEAGLIDLGSYGWIEPELPPRATRPPTGKAAARQQRSPKRRTRR
jgi:methylated-DNA-protein-cysteine methyltransferase related protein